MLWCVPTAHQALTAAKNLLNELQRAFQNTNTIVLAV